MRALVTGGAGFIGSHLVDALLARGDEVMVLDDLSTGKRDNLVGAVNSGAEVVEVDVSDGAPTVTVGARFGPEVVFHLAAQVDVRVSVADPGFDARINVLGTVNALEVARRAEARRFVFASTGGAIYGEGEGRRLPFTEEDRCEPFAPYGQSKLAGEGFVEHYRVARGVPGISLRLGNVYGPRQDPSGEAGVVAIFCGLAKGGARPVVFGSGEQTRDYVYIDDVVRALLAAGDGEVTGPVNVGTGKETSVLRLAEMIGSLAGRDDFEPEMAAPREGEVERTALDPERAAAELGWRAQTPLEKGLSRTVASF